MPVEQVAPGAEFLLRRLARAEALSPAERTPDVAAFVDSVRLLRQVCQLLPLTASGEAALPLHSPATQRQLQLALANFAQACYLSPGRPVCELNQSRHLVVYCRGYVLGTLNCAGDAAGSSSADPKPMAYAPELGQVLLSHAWVAAAGEEWGRAAVLHALQLGKQALTMLEGEQARRQISSQLEEVGEWETAEQLRLQAQVQAQAQARPQAFTLAQLHHATSCAVVQLAMNASCTDIRRMPAGHAAGLPGSAAFLAAATRTQLPGAYVKAATHLVCSAVELRTPKSLTAAASPASLLGERQRGASLYLRSFELARQQGSDFYTAFSPTLAFMEAAAWPASLSRGTVQAIHTAFKDVQPAIRRCRQVLPQPWVEELESSFQAAQKMQGAAQALLQHAASSPDERRQAIQRVLASMPDDTPCTCAGCGQHSAVGLRRCGACKKVQYCRWVGGRAGEREGWWVRQHLGGW